METGERAMSRRRNIKSKRAEGEMSLAVQEREKACDWGVVNSSGWGTGDLSGSQRPFTQGLWVVRSLSDFIHS